MVTVSYLGSISNHSHADVGDLLQSENLGGTEDKIAADRTTLPTHTAALYRVQHRFAPRAWHLSSYTQLGTAIKKISFTAYQVPRHTETCYISEPLNALRGVRAPARIQYSKYRAIRECSGILGAGTTTTTTTSHRCRRQEYQELGNARGSLLLAALLQPLGRESTRMQGSWTTHSRQGGLVPSRYKPINPRRRALYTTLQSINHACRMPSVLTWPGTEQPRLSLNKRPGELEDPDLQAIVRA
ncbi:hypothetical protein CHU98_g1411 [Xylaria longipes]|nr:hypothetical protein CHU98_g1411 [Xylaria longipes]